MTGAKIKKRKRTTIRDEVKLNSLLNMVLLFLIRNRYITRAIIRIKERKLSTNAISTRVIVPDIFSNKDLINE